MLIPYLVLGILGILFCLDFLAMFFYYLLEHTFKVKALTPKFIAIFLIIFAILRLGDVCMQINTIGFIFIVLYDSNKTYSIKKAEKKLIKLKNKYDNNEIDLQTYNDKKQEIVECLKAK